MINGSAYMLNININVSGVEREHETDLLFSDVSPGVIFHLQARMF